MEALREQNFRGIQALRGVAALLVMLFHALEAWNSHFRQAAIAWPNGAAGVDIFFVISGFVMTLSARRLDAVCGAWRRFAAHRLRRIVPLYWICSAVKLAAVAAAPGLALRTKLTIAYVAASFLFLPLHDQNGAFKPLLPVGWTLSFEMLFYVLFAAGLKLRMASPLLLIAPLVALTMLPHAPGSVAGELCNPILLEFGFGIAVAVAMERGWTIPFAWAAVLLAVASAVILLVPSGGTIGRVVAFGLPASAIVAATAALEPVAGAKIPRPLRLLGDASYAIYLSHGFVLAALASALPRIVQAVGAGAALGLWLAGAVLASLLLGYALHAKVEKPLMQALKATNPRRVGFSPPTSLVHPVPASTPR